MIRGKSARDFAIDLRKFGDVTWEKATIIFRKITLELDQRVVLSTPVDIGRARGNWFPSLNAPSTSTEATADPTGAATLAAIEATVDAAELGDITWLTNNLPYILKLENGHSQQAPQGMVDINLQAVADFYGGSIVR
jgi:hypothetical protein